MVITGYFAQMKKYKEAGLPLVSISLYKPEWLTEAIDTYPDLYPTKDMLYDYKETEDMNQYIKSYTSLILDKLNPEKVYNDLNNKIILCYERPTDFCHRHLVSIWLNQHNFECREFNVSNQLHQPTWGYRWD